MQNEISRMHTHICSVVLCTAEAEDPRTISRTREILA